MRQDARIIPIHLHKGPMYPPFYMEEQVCTHQRAETDTVMTQGIKPRLTMLHSQAASGIGLTLTGGKGSRSHRGLIGPLLYWSKEVGIGLTLITTINQRNYFQARAPVLHASTSC